MQQSKLKVGTRVRWTKEYIDRWIFSHDNWTACQPPFKSDDHDYGQEEYDQEILLAMFTIMGAPVWGMVKGPGADSDTVLVMIHYSNCTNWSYCDVKDLEIVDAV